MRSLRLIRCCPRRGSRLKGGRGEGREGGGRQEQGRGFGGEGLRKGKREVIARLARSLFSCPSPQQGTIRTREDAGGRGPMPFVGTRR